MHIVDIAIPASCIHLHWASLVLYASEEVLPDVCELARDMDFVFSVSDIAWLYLQLDYSAFMKAYNAVLNLWK